MYGLPIVSLLPAAWLRNQIAQRSNNQSVLAAYYTRRAKELRAAAQRASFLGLKKQASQYLAKALQFEAAAAKALTTTGGTGAAALAASGIQGGANSTAYAPSGRNAVRQGTRPVAQNRLPDLQASAHFFPGSGGEFQASVPDGSGGVVAAPDDTPFYKKPLFWGLGLLVAGGAYYYKKKRA